VTGAALAALLLAAGCGGDDDEAASGESSEYCKATTAIETAPFPDIDFESMSPEQLSSATKQFATSTLRPMADRVVAAAPDEIADDIAVLNGAVTQLEETGDFETFESPQVEEASNNAHNYDLKHCGWDEVDVTATEYKFEKVPKKIDAGLASFELDNKGKELHEIVVLRRNDGVTESFDQLLDLPEEEAMEKATVLGQTGGLPGEKGIYLVSDLQPGQYAMVCFVPQGTVTEEPSEEGGPPHFTLGMKQEFTVEA